MEFLETSWLVLPKKQKYKFWIRFVYPGGMEYKTIQTNSWDEVFKSVKEYPSTITMSMIDLLHEYPINPDEIELNTQKDYFGITMYSGSRRIYIFL